MATITSHVLNAVNGTHAGGVRVDCGRIGDDGRAEPVFSVESGADGRIAGTAEVDGTDEGRVHELVFHTGEYFDREGLVEQARTMPAVVFRLRLPNPDARYHVPVIFSPHGYSVWCPVERRRSRRAPGGDGRGYGSDRRTRPTPAAGIRVR